MPGQLGGAFEEGARLDESGAEAAVAGEQADHGDQQAADRRVADRMGVAKGGEEGAVLRRGQQHQAREGAAGQTAGDGDQQHPYHLQMALEAGEADPAEIGGVAEQGLRHHAGEHDGDDQQAAHALVEAAVEFLDGEHDAGQRRVEGGGDARRAAGGDQMAALDVEAARQMAMQAVHHGGADLHHRPFAARRKAGEQRGGGQNDLAQGDFQRQQRAPAGRRLLVDLDFRQRLRNAAALAARKPATRRPDHGRAAGRTDEQRPPPVPLGNVAEGPHRAFGEFGEEHGQQADADGARPDQQATLPEMQPGDAPLAPRSCGRRRRGIRCADRSRPPA